MLAAVDSDLVAKAFTRLSDRHQRILHLREGSGWSYQRIADHEGVGITAVETLLWRARQALKREFATLAGAEGRFGAWLGGALSLAGLKRLLSLPARAMRRTAHSGVQGAALAAGSAVAATAMVIGAVSSPATTAGSDSTPRADFSQVPTTSLPLSTATPAPAAPVGGTDTSGGSGSGSGGSGGTGLPSSPLPGGGGGKLGGTLQNAGGTLNTVGVNLQTGVNTLLGPNPLSTTVQGTTSTVDNLLGTSGTTSGSTTTLGGTVNNVLGSSTSLLGGL
jgi:hypothetical protein